MDREGIAQRLEHMAEQVDALLPKDTLLGCHDWSLSKWGEVFGNFGTLNTDVRCHIGAWADRLDQLHAKLWETTKGLAFLAPPSDGSPDNDLRTTALFTAGALLRQMRDDLRHVAGLLRGDDIYEPGQAGREESDRDAFGFAAGAEKIRQAKSQETQSAVEARETPPYVEIDLAARTLTVGEKRITPSDKVWEFLKELADATRHSLPDLKPAEWKNAMDMLRTKIGKDMLRFVVESTERGYKLAPNVKLRDGGQVGIRKTK